MKKIFFRAAIAAVVGVAGYFGYNSKAPSHEFTDTEMENIEALADGEISVVGCKPMKGATCYVFDASGQLVDRQKNQYPGQWEN
jgi:hypothetical protein